MWFASHGIVCTPRPMDIAAIKARSTLDARAFLAVCRHLRGAHLASLLLLAALFLTDVVRKRSDVFAALARAARDWSARLCLRLGFGRRRSLVGRCADCGETSEGSNCDGPTVSSSAQSRFLEAGQAKTPLEVGGGGHEILEQRSPMYSSPHLPLPRQSELAPTRQLRPTFPSLGQLWPHVGPTWPKLAKLRQNWPSRLRAALVGGSIEVDIVRHVV